MIFVRLFQEAMGEDPVVAHSNLISDLLDKHTESNVSTFEEVHCVVRYPNGSTKHLDDSITRYADDNIVLYNYEEKIDPEHFILSIQGKTVDGHKQMQHILDDIRRHPAYRGRITEMVLVGIKNDQPQCIPCMKKRIKGGN